MNHLKLNTNLNILWQSATSLIAKYLKHNINVIVIICGVLRPATFMVPLKESDLTNEQ
jgi:hypothetical protein